MRLLLLLEVLHFFGCQFGIEDFVQLNLRLEALDQHLDGHVERACVDMDVRLLLAFHLVSVPLQTLRVSPELAVLLAQSLFEKLAGTVAHCPDVLQTLENVKAETFGIGGVRLTGGLLVDLKDFGVHLSQFLIGHLVLRGLLLAEILHVGFWTLFL